MTRTKFFKRQSSEKMTKEQGRIRKVEMLEERFR